MATLVHAPLTDTDSFGMPDYCAACARYGCSRFDTITEPTEIFWTGTSAMVTAFYICPYGHAWTCHWGTGYLFADTEMETA